MSSAKTNIRVQVAVATMADATWRARLEGQRVDAIVAGAGRVLRAAAGESDVVWERAMAAYVSVVKTADCRRAASHLALQRAAYHLALSNKATPGKKSKPVHQRGHPPTRQKRTKKRAKRHRTKEARP